jgi:phosphoserine phosphatase
VLLLPAVAAQQEVRDKAEGGARRADTAQRQAEQAARRAQAIEVLKGVVEGAAEIRETQTRVAVVTGALDLLWKHDEAYTRANFIKSAAALSDRFASDATNRRERSEIRE